MELIESILVTSIAVQTSVMLVLSILGSDTPKLMKIIAWIASVVVIIMVGVMISKFDECANQECPKYKVIKGPVYLKIE